jgi:hypothetical protein
MIKISAQESQSTVLHYTPERGFELDIPLTWGIRTCYGQIYVDMISNEKMISSDSYIYEGKRYTISDLGREAFEKPEAMGIAVGADVYVGSSRLGSIEMDYILSVSAGCYGTSVYKIFEPLGLKDDNYIDQLESISLQNLKVLRVSCSDAGVENQISEMLDQAQKREEYISYYQEAEQAYANGNYEEAAKLYSKAVNSGYKNVDPSLPDKEALLQKKEMAEKEAELLAEQEKMKEEEANDSSDGASSSEDSQDSMNSGNTINRELSDRSVESKFDELQTNDGYEVYQQYQENAREIEASKAQIATDVSNMVMTIYNDIEANRIRQYNQMMDRMARKQEEMYQAYEKRKRNQDIQESSIGNKEEKLLSSLLHNITALEILNGEVVLYGYDKLTDNTGYSFIDEEDILTKIVIGDHTEINTDINTIYFGGAGSRVWYGEIKKSDQDFLLYSCDIDDGEILKAEYPYKSHSISLPTGNPRVFAKYWENEVCIFNFIKDELYCIYPDKGGNGNVIRLSSSSSGRYLAVTVRNWGENMIQVFDLEKSDEIPIYRTEARLYTRTKFSEDEKSFYFIDGDSELNNVDLEDLDINFSHKISAKHYLIAPDDESYFTFNGSTIEKVDSNTGERSWAHDFSSSEPSKQVCISPDSRYIILNNGSELRILQSSNGKTICSFPVNFSNLTGIKFISSSLFGCFNDNGFEDAYVKLYNINNL